MYAATNNSMKRVSEIMVLPHTYTQTHIHTNTDKHTHTQKHPHTHTRTHTHARTSVLSLIGKLQLPMPFSKITPPEKKKTLAEILHYKNYVM